MKTEVCRERLGRTWALVGEFTEVESERKSERPELAKALDGKAIRIR